MATAKPKSQVGTMACVCCGHEIPVKQAEGGTLHAPCPWCDFPAYAKAGTEAHRIFTGKLKGKAEPAPVQAARPEPIKTRAAAPTPAAAPAPAPRARNSVFDL